MLPLFRAVVKYFYAVEIENKFLLKRKSLQPCTPKMFNSWRFQISLLEMQGELIKNKEISGILLRE